MKMLDLFSGIGGFHLGLEQAGFKFDWVGFSDIDKYANTQYKKRFPNAKELGSVTDVQPGRDTPAHIDLLCGGFPCQSFSIAGLRGGFEDTRGTLIFEIVRILRHYKDSGNPIPCFVIENVKGLLSHDSGRTFATIYRVLTDLDYTVECQLLNTRWFLPQNRARIYIVGHFRGEPRPKVFPIGETSKIPDKDRSEFRTVAILPESDKPKGNWLPRERVLDVNGISRAISTSESQHPYYETGLKQIGVLEKDAQQNRVYSTEGISKTGLYMEGNKIRRLSPKECSRLQGFPDWWCDGQSDAQKYKQLGNAVSVPVVKAVGERLLKHIS